MNYYLIVLLFFILTGCKVEKEEGDPADNDGLLNESYEIDIPCFLYHRIGDSRYPSTNTPGDLFEKHLGYLVANNYKFITLTKAIQIIDNKGDTNQKYVVITVDDGFKSFYDNGLPLLKKYNAIATLFVNTKTIGEGSYMTWSELDNSARAGIEIGNHTHSHPFFLNISSEQRLDSFQFEIERAQKLIEENLGVEPSVFAYPYGEFDNDMLAILRKSGFKGAAAQNSGVLCERSDRFAIPRFPMGTPYASMTGFKQKAGMKALRVIKKSPDQAFFKENPPELTLAMDTTGLVKSQIQFFVYGDKSPVEWINHNTVKIKHDKQLRARRTLYTITIPSRNNEWHWYSHLWVNPGIADQ